MTEAPGTPEPRPLQRLRGLLTVSVDRGGFLCAVKPWHVLLGSYVLFSVVWVLNAQKPWAFAMTRTVEHWSS